MNTKKYLFSLFVLVSALPGFAADSVVPEDGSETNVVVLTEAQYAALTNSYDRIISSMSNIVEYLDFQVDMGASNSNLLSTIRQDLITTISSHAYLYDLFVFLSDGSITYSQSRNKTIVELLGGLARNLRSLSFQFHYFVSGTEHSAYTPSKYNFVELFKIVDDLRSGLSDLLDAFDGLNVFLRDNISSVRNDISVARAYIESIRDFLVAQLPYMTSIIQGGTNQLQTIIYIISNRFDQVHTNLLDGSQFEVLTNYLDGISDGLSNIAPGGGDPSSPGGGSSSVDLSYFDKWLKDWVDKYFYPADSDYTALYNDLGALNPKYPTFGTPFHASFDVPYFAADYNQQVPGLSSGDYFRMDRPYWGNAFNNTMEAFNSGHSNYYDVVSALLTDIQSVNAQNYALFYVLATNILLQSADADVSETQQDVNSLEAKIESYSSDVETMKTDLEYKFNSLKNKYEDIKEKSDQIFSYLGGLARLPQQDYYFDLPKLQLGEDLEFGGMEITLPLTNQSLVMVAEILRFFSICLYWGLFISMLYYAARGVVKMFLLLFKFMIYMGAIGTDK